MGLEESHQATHLHRRAAVVPCFMIQLAKLLVEIFAPLDDPVTSVKMVSIIGIRAETLTFWRRFEFYSLSTLQAASLWAD